MNASESRSKSVYKDQVLPRNGSNGSRSTASHSSGLPPALKKTSSISADYGNNYEQKINENLNKRGKFMKQKLLNNISAQKHYLGRRSEEAPGLNVMKGRSINNEYSGHKLTDFSTELSSTKNIENPKRHPSRRLSSLKRTESSKNNLPIEPPESTDIGPDFTIIHVIDENRNKEKDFKCSLPVLIRHMKYFEKHMQSPISVENIDISVH